MKKYSIGQLRGAYAAGLKAATDGPPGLPGPIGRSRGTGPGRDKAGLETAIKSLMGFLRFGPQSLSNLIRWCSKMDDGPVSESMLRRAYEAIGLETMRTAETVCWRLPAGMRYVMTAADIRREVEAIEHRIDAQLARQLAKPWDEQVLECLGGLVRDHGVFGVFGPDPDQGALAYMKQAITASIVNGKMEAFGQAALALEEQVAFNSGDGPAGYMARALDRYVQDALENQQVPVADCDHRPDHLESYSGIETFIVYADSNINRC